MSQPKPESRRRSGGRAVVVAAVLLLALPVLYFLSIGPAAWLVVNGYLPDAVDDALDAFYIPIAWLVDHSEFCRNVIAAYMSLWIDLP